MKKLVKRYIPSKVLWFIYRWLNGNFNYLLWVFPVNNSKIVICNFHGKAYGDNSKYVASKLIEDGMDCEIVWLINEKARISSVFPEQIRRVKYKSIRGLYELATAKIWIDNCRKEFFPPKRKEQFYIQTWHGGISLKKIEKDSEAKLNKMYVQTAKKDSENVDLFISNSSFCTELYRNAFWYDGKILESGSPRCDILLNKSRDAHMKVRSHFNVDYDTNILIYAPTFRVDSNTKPYEIDFNNLVKSLNKRFEGNWIVLVRLHPNISKKSNYMQYTSDVMNATNYDDMYELLAASDILITDYSSTMFEFSLTNKPVILFAPDIEAYKEDRNFYFDIHTLPYPVAEDNDQLSDAIEHFDLNAYKIETNEFLSRLGIKENGDASNIIVEKIKSIMP